MRGYISNFNSFLKSLFEPEIRIFGWTVGLSDEPFIDKAYRFNGENGTMPKKGLKPSYATAIEAKDALIKYIMEKDGIEVIPETHRNMLSRYNRDVIGWRDGEIRYATDRFGVPLSDGQQLAVIAHEYAAGDGHEMSDEQAQAGAVELLKGFYPRGVPTAMRMWDAARGDPHWN